MIVPLKRLLPFTRPSVLVPRRPQPMREPRRPEPKPGALRQFERMMESYADLLLRDVRW